jgi:hypothetical protein
MQGGLAAGLYKPHIIVSLNYMTVHFHIYTWCNAAFIDKILVTAS